MIQLRHSRVRTCISIVAIVFIQGAVHSAEALPGRLFFTPAERRTLEYRRQHPEPQVLPSAHTPPRAFRFDGMVWRQQRLIALWIDRKPIDADRLWHADLGRGQLVLIDSAGEHARLYAGQHWPPANQAQHPAALIANKPVQP